MKVGGTHYRSLWLAEDGWSVNIVDQTLLPGQFYVARLSHPDEVARAIRSMQVRGAPLIGVAAAYGVALAMRGDPSDSSLDAASTMLLATRPTAVNLAWAIERMRTAVGALKPNERGVAAYRLAARMADEDVAVCEQIGMHGVAVVRHIAKSKRNGDPVQILTHCNTGWLATIDWGTALSVIYRAFDEGIPLHVWVDETRPRNQGYLTAWELGQHGVPNTVIVDNAGGLLMQQGRVDLCLVGTDRTTRSGDVANKIGTYLKALAARDNHVPFYAAVPASSIDWSLVDGGTIPIEERDPAEIHQMPGVSAYNPGFDVTPARLITGLITDRGVTTASEAGLLSLFPEQRQD